jgi:hypothetical protein
MRRWGRSSAIENAKAESKSGGKKEGSSGGASGSDTKGTQGEAPQQDKRPEKE